MMAPSLFTKNHGRHETPMYIYDICIYTHTYTQHDNRSLDHPTLRGISHLLSTAWNRSQRAAGRWGNHHSSWHVSLFPQYFLEVLQLLFIFSVTELHPNLPFFSSESHLHIQSACINRPVVTIWTNSLCWTNMLDIWYFRTFTFTGTYSLDYRVCVSYTDLLNA